MTIVRKGGLTYKYFNDAEATADTALAKPPAGRALVNCPKCGKNFIKPRALEYLPDGGPKCMMQRKK